VALATRSARSAVVKQMEHASMLLTMRAAMEMAGKWSRFRLFGAVEAKDLEELWKECTL
jgi:hypothetical protein